MLKTAEHVGSNRRMPVQNPYAKPSARQSGAMYGNSKLNSDHYEFPPEDDEIENTIAMLPITHTGAFPLRPSQNASKNESQQEQFQKHVSTTIHADGSIQYPTLSWSSSPLVAVNGKSESQKSMSRAGIQYPKLPRPDRSHEDDQANHHTSLKAERAAVEISRKATHPHSTSAPEKRSRLPWNLDAERPNSDNQTSSFGDVSQQTLPNPRPDDRMPWNTVKASVKAEQARLRKPISMPTKGKKLSANVEPGMEGNQPTIRRIGGSNKIGKLFMSQEQKAIIRMVVDEGKSVFFTGSAGTGKSVLLRELITELRHKYKREGDRVAVTASTGLAACNIGGVTLHSFSGIGLGKESADELVKKILKNNKAKQRWIRSKVLVIDEISMVDGDLFDKLEHIAKKIRKNGRPFGGIQLVITGDFFQLPPVPDSGKLAKFCFEGATWPISIHHTIGLTQVFRQKDAGGFPS